MRFPEGRFPEKGAFMKNADGELLLGVGGEFQRVETLSPGDSEVFYLKDFYERTFLRYQPEKIFRLSTTEVDEFLSGLPSPELHFTSLGNEDRLYEEDFRTLLRSFSPRLRKVVMISRENFKVPDASDLAIHFLKRSLSFPSGFSYGLWGSDHGIMGSTPEELFTLNDGELSTYALAGTGKLGEELALLHSQKDRLEHDIVIQDISEKLEGFSDRIEVEDTRTIPYRNLIHLRTDIRAAIDPGVNVTSLVEALSPTAALGGYPQKEALEFLRKSKYFEAHPERIFGSAFGVVTKTTSRFLVMIRNVQWKRDEVFIECGGGIVPGSKIESELAEIALKRSVVKDHYL